MKCSIITSCTTITTTTSY